jgi:glycosyltransferase involved in cell wall biosynthesis
MRPRLLFLCQTLPFPADSGVHIRSFNILRLLAREFDVTAVCFYRKANRTTPEQVERSIKGLREFAEVHAFPIPQEHSAARLLADHARSVLTLIPYTRFAHQSGAVRQCVANLLGNGRFDIVHVDSLDLAALLPLLKDLPVVCTHHNVESDLLRRRSAAEGVLLRRLYVKFQAGLMAREEQRWCPRVDMNAVVSPVDEQIFERRIPDARFTLVPNGVDIEFMRPGNRETSGVVFVGSHGWLPNRDAMEYFCAQILPSIHRSHPALDVTWVGRAPESVRESYLARHNVRLTGYVDDIRPYLEAASCYIVPLRMGGGTRLKILDAWAMSKAVVSTSVGCEGLEARDGENILIRDDPAEFAAAVQRVLEDRGLRERLGRNARRTAEEIYSWDVIGESMIDKYRALLGGAIGAAVHDKSPRTLVV